MLQSVHGSGEQGFYSVGYRLSAIAFLFTSAMTPVLTREMAFAHEKKDMDLLKELFDRVQIFLFIATVLCAYIAINTDSIIKLLGSKEYSDARLPIFLMAVYPIHQTFGQLSNSLFLATGQTKKYAKIGMLCMLMGIPLTYFFIAPASYAVPGLGLSATGLAIKMLLWQFIVNNIFLYYNMKILNQSFKKWIHIQLKVIGSVFTVALLSQILTGYTLSSLLLFKIEVNKVIYALVEMAISLLIYFPLITALVYVYPNIVGVNRSEIKSFLLKLKRRFY